MQARACRQLAQSILLQQKYQHDGRIELAFVYLDAALHAFFAKDGANPTQGKALRHLLNNLRAIDTQLMNIESEQWLESQQQMEESLADDGLTGWSDIRLRISRHLTPRSALFRHAIRMSALLCGGVCAYSTDTHAARLLDSAHQPVCVSAKLQCNATAFGAAYYRDAGRHTDWDSGTLFCPLA